MVSLATEYSQTNAELQANINEALIQLGNIRQDITVLGVGEFTPPDAPSITQPSPTFPERPPAPNLQGVAFDPVSVGGVTANVPSAPGIDRPTQWSGPSAPAYRTGFEQFFAGDEDTPEEIIERANEQVSKWVDDYFPALGDCFQNVPEQWICDVISGVQPLGNSEQAIEIAWRTAKANQHREMQSAKRTLSAEFASRGFSLPPGAMLAATQRLHERGFDATSAVNREAALKDVDVRVRLLELAVSTAAQLKQGLLGIMSDYYRVIASLSNDAAQYGIEKARIKAQADTQFNEAMLRYSDINQTYYRSLRDNVLQHNGQTISLYSASLAGVDTKVRADSVSQQLQLDAARTNAENKRTEVQANTDVARTNASVYQTSVQAEAARVGATNEVNRILLDQYRTEVEAKLAEANAKAPSSVGTALSGAAGAFGQIAAAAANASGTLIARIEGV